MPFSVCLCYNREGFSHNQWDYVLYNFAPHSIYILECEPEYILHSNVIGKARAISSADELPDIPLVVLAATDGRNAQGHENLREFMHPENCVYLFGPDHAHLSDDHLGSRSPDHLVYIPTDGTAKTMYSWQAAAVVLWDRRLKHG